MAMKDHKDWKALLSKEQKAQVDDAIASKIDEVINRSYDFWKAPQVWQKSVLAKLVRLFHWRDDDGYQVPADKVFVLATENGMVVSLHYFVYLRLAEKQGIKLIAFEPLDGYKGERLRLIGTDGIERTFSQLYDHYEFLREKKKSWQAHFSVMFKKTMFKQALAFFFPLVIENSTFAEIAHFDEDEVVNGNGNGNGNGHVELSRITETEKPTDFMEKERLIERLRFLAEKIKDDGVARVYLKNAVKEAGFELYNADSLFNEGVKKLMMRQLSVDALKELCGVADAIYECIDDKSMTIKDVLNLRKQTLETVKKLTDTEKKARIKQILADNGYGTVTEIGRLSVLRKINNLLHSEYETETEIEHGDQEATEIWPF